MITLTHNHIHTYNRYDPTRTLTLRRRFERDMRKRFAELRGVIRMAIVDRDALGLTSMTVFQVTPPSHGQFNFPRSDQKVEAFMAWLNVQIERSILEGSGSQVWINKYISQAYERGVYRARGEMIQAGFPVPSLDVTGGIETSMAALIHSDRSQLLFTRVFSELKGISSQMEQQIGRVLSEGIVAGDNPRRLAQKLVSIINGKGIGELGITDTLGRFIPAQRRAETLARTEVIRAHHQAMVEEYRNWGVEGVTVQAEWRTADDNRVCPQCSPLQGEIFSLDEAQNMIPLHPQCRCMVLPFRDKK